MKDSGNSLDTQQLTRKRNYILLAIFAAALVVRLAYIGEIHANSPFSRFAIIDAIEYHGSALEITGNIPAVDFAHRAYYHPPLYPYFLAFVYKLFSVSFANVHVVQAILGALSCVLVFLIAEKYFSFKVAVVAGFTAVFYRHFIFFTGELLTTTLGIFLGLLSLYLISLALSKDIGDTRKKYLLLSAGGLALGLFAITIPNILLFGGFVAIYIALEKRLKNRRVLLACFLASFLLPVGVVSVRNYVVSGEFVLICHEGGEAFYVANNPDSEKTKKIRPGYEWFEITDMPLAESGRREMTDSQRSMFFFKKSFSYIFTHPVHYTGAQARKVVRFFNHVEIGRNADFYFQKPFSVILTYNPVIYLLISPLAVLGLIMFFGKRREFALLYGYFLLYFLSLVAYFVTGRYRLPVIPVMIIFASAAVFKLLDLRGDRKLLAKYLAVLAGLFVFVSVDWFGDYIPPERNAENFLYAGNAYFADGEPVKARQSYEKAVAIEPDNPEILRGFGCFLTAQSNFSEAEKKLNMAVELNPDYYAPYIPLAELREKQGDFRKAVKNLHKAVKAGKMKNETWLVVFLMLGRNHFNLGEFDRAEAALKNALLIYPRNAEVLANLGVLYGATKRYEEAVTILESAISQAPGYAKAYNDLLLVHIIRQDTVAVREVLGRAKSNSILIDPQLLRESKKILQKK